jgi:hypothetical protein
LGSLPSITKEEKISKRKMRFQQEESKIKEKEEDFLEKPFTRMTYLQNKNSIRSKSKLQKAFIHV